MATPAPERSTHVVLLACPGTGHVLPVAELARRVVEVDGFTATLVRFTNFSSGDQYSATFASLPPSVSTALLPEVSIEDLPADARAETRIIAVVKRALPHLRDLLRSLVDDPTGRGVAAFVPDLFCPWALEVAAELGIPGYIFCPTNLMALLTLLHTPELDRTITCEFRDLPELIRLPGCVPLHGADLLDTIQDRANPAYALIVDIAKLYLLAQGFLVNTFDAMEHETIVAFKGLSDKGVYPPAYGVGPFIRRPCSDESSKHSSLRWLNDQPDGSVLYVCFGSGGTLSTEQTSELAAGLEASGQRFLWVMQFPSDNDKCASFFGGGRGDGDSPVNYLPEGFAERTKGTGLAVPLWAPQVEILSHRAVGGFVSHCGWNSTLEAVAAGVPTIAWPMYAEQRMNAKMLSERAGMALRLKAREDGLVTRDEVAAVARELMAGEKGAAARKKARELGEEMEKGLLPDGASRKALEDVAGRWKAAGNRTAA
jgi:hydroquinone glucosyltransferase